MRSGADQYLDWFGETGANLLISAPRVLHRLKAVPSNGAAYAALGVSTRLGRNTVKIVPLCPGVVRLRTRIEPLCFCTMPCESHKPRPVLISFLVVWKGWKSG